MIVRHGGVKWGGTEQRADAWARGRRVCEMVEPRRKPIHTRIRPLSSLEVRGQKELQGHL